MRTVIAILLVALLGLGSPPAFAAMSLDQAVRIVKRQTDGRILSAEPVRRGNHIFYRIKVLTSDGHVRVITIDGGRVDDGRGGGRSR